MKNKKTLFFIPQYNYYGNLDRTIKKHGKDVPVKNIMVCHISLTEEILKEMIVSLFRRGQIWITKKEQKVLHFENLDEYFKEYGKSIVDNLKSILKPVSELNGKIDRAVLNNIRLYPQQAAMVNGIYEYFRRIFKNERNVLQFPWVDICNHTLGESTGYINVLSAFIYLPIKEFACTQAGGQVKYPDITVAYDHRPFFTQMF